MATMGIMLTCTTYGTWLRGDRRGWIDDGKLMPADACLEESDRRRMKHDVFTFDPNEILKIGDYIGSALIERMSIRVLAMTVQTWHVHVLVGITNEHVGRVVKCLKDAVRYGLRPGRPIWSEGYDKRFCFDDATLLARQTYVGKHNERAGWGARLWEFLEPYVG